MIEPCLKKVTNETLALWHKASLPTRSDQSVLKDVRKLWMTKERKRKRWEKYGGTTVSMSTLFDISNRARAPELEADRAFLADQRGARRLRIGGLDRDTTSLWRRRSKRTAQEAKRNTRVDSTSSPMAFVTTTGSSATADSLAGPSSGTISYPGCNRQ